MRSKVAFIALALILPFAAARAQQPAAGALPEPAAGALPAAGAASGPTESAAADSAAVPQSGAGAGADRKLAVTREQVARLGLEWRRPPRVAEFAVGSAPAAVVVPPSQEAIVSAPVGGLVTRVLVAEGSAVEAGQALVELRSTELLGQEREYLDALSARRLAEAQLARDEGLRKDGIIAERRLQETKAQTNSARVRLEAARQQLHLAGFDDAALEKLGASGTITADLTLRAPFAGTVVERRSTLGQQVQAQAPVARIANLERLWLELRVPQERADAVRVGMHIRVEPRGESAMGEIFQVGRIVDPATQTVLVRGSIDNARGTLRAGQTLPARILGSGVGGALAAPKGAVVRLDGRAFVFVRRAEGFDLRPVRPLGEDDGHVYVDAASLDGSSEIAVKGVAALKSMLLGGEDD